MKRIFLLLWLLPCFVGATVTTTSVQEDGGGDYTTLEAAVTALTTVGATDTMEIVISEGWAAHDNATLDFDGVTIAGLVLIRTEGLSRHSGVWCDTCHIAEQTSQLDVRVQESPWKFDGLQIFWSNASATGLNSWSTNRDDSVVWENTLFQSNHKIIWGTATQNANNKGDIFRNCLFFDTTQAGGYAAAPIYMFRDYHRMIFYNCTFSNGGQVFYDDFGCGNWTVIFKNCLISGMSNGQSWDFSIDNGCSDSVTVENCAWDDSAGAVVYGATNLYNQTFTFKDSAHGTWDFHLDDADAGAQGLGADLSAVAYGFTNDVDGGYRHPNWDIDIGYDQVGSGSQVVKIIADADDAFRDTDDIYATYESQDIGNYSGAASDGGWRFQGVQIPDSSNIYSSTLKLVAFATTSDATVNLLIDLEDADDAAAFSTIGDFEGRVHTTANAAWSSLPTWTADVIYTSPDFSDAVHEVVDRPGWTVGNDVAVFTNDNGSSSGALRHAYGYNHTPAFAGEATFVWFEDTTEVAPPAGASQIIMLGVIDEKDNSDVGVDRRVFAVGGDWRLLDLQERLAPRLRQRSLFSVRGRRLSMFATYVTEL
ncbi:MAG TPA: hypothetical protein VFI02_14220 [Armatimonadota bacterium]|nr:hypothetical protein [Armatimonadota bacterium]